QASLPRPGLFLVGLDARPRRGVPSPFARVGRDDPASGELLDGALLLDGFDGAGAEFADAGDRGPRRKPLGDEVSRQDRAAATQASSAMDGDAHALGAGAGQGRDAVVELLLGWGLHVHDRDVQDEQARVVRPVAAQWDFAQGQYDLDAL